MSVFKVNNNFTVVVNIDAVKLVPELSTLTQEELLYIILVYDYVDSPYRKQPIEERQIMATKKIFGDTNINLSEKLILAIDGYKSLIFDIRRETIDVYKTKCQKMQKEILTQSEMSFSRVKELEQTITYLNQRISDMEHSLDIEEKEEIEIKGKKALSQVEIWQRRMRSHKEYKDSL